MLPPETVVEFAPDRLSGDEVRTLLQRGTVVGKGQQGLTYVCDTPVGRLAIKVVTATGVTRFLRLRMLRHEFQAYQRLQGLDGIPRCYGLVDGRYLILDYIEGTPRHRAQIADRAKFFSELFDLIARMHQRGVAHGDLQNRENLLMRKDGRPGVLDLGMSVIRGGRLNLVNRVLFRFLSRLDWNTWVKLKYNGHPENASYHDQHFYRRTWIERLARVVKENVVAKVRGRRAAHAKRGVGRRPWVPTVSRQR